MFADPENLAPRFGRLRDGTPVVTRPITPGDAGSLVAGLRRLSPKGNAYRFLHHRKRFSEAELHYLTHCDFVNHIGVVLGRTDESGQEVDPVGVARCIRTPEDPDLAEVAIVLVDEYHGRGAGTRLLEHLADLAWERGIRAWRALILDGNSGGEKLLARFGGEVRRCRPGGGTSEVTFRLFPRGTAASHAA